MRGSVVTMGRPFYFLGFLFSFMLFMAYNTLAQDKNVLYQVRNIQVNVSEKNAAVAREKGLYQAQETAFSTLSKRLLPDDDFIPEIDHSTIESMIDSFQISDEKISSTQYQATVHIDFIPQIVENYFRSLGRDQILSPSPPVLVVPFWQKAEQATNLWDKNNEWSNTWSQQVSHNQLIPIVLPLGDLQDRSEIPDLSVLSQSSSYFQPIMQRYGVKKIVIAVLSTTTLSDHEGSQVFLMTYEEADTNQSQTLSITDLSAHQTVFQKGVDRSVQFLETEWKRKASQQSDQSSVIRVYSEFQELGDWVKLQQKLKNLSTVKALDLEKLSQGRADFQLTIKGSVNALKLDLQSYGFQLSEPSPHFGNISFNNGAVRYRLYQR